MKFSQSSLSDPAPLSSLRTVTWPLIPSKRLRCFELISEVVQQRPQMTPSRRFPYVTPISNQLTNKRWVKGLRKSLLFRRSWPWKRPACLLKHFCLSLKCVREVAFCGFASIPSSSEALVGHTSSLVQHTHNSRAQLIRCCISLDYSWPLVLPHLFSPDRMTAGVRLWVIDFSLVQSYYKV